MSRINRWRVAFIVCWLTLALGAASRKSSRVGEDASTADLSASVRPPAHASPSSAGNRAESQLTAPATSSPVSLPTSPSIAERARTLQNSGRTDEAVALFRQEAQQGSLTNAARMQYAWLLNTEGRYAEAWQVLQPVPDNSRQALDVRARTAAWAGELQPAAALLPRLLVKNPGDAVAWALLANVQRQLGDTTGYRQSLEHVLELQPRDLQARRSLVAELAAHGEVAIAIAQERQIIEQQRSAGDLAMLATLYEQSGRLAEAVVAAEQALALDSRNADLQYRLARLFRWTAQPDKAIALYERASADAATTDRGRVEGELGLALVDAHRYADALPKLDASLQRDPADPALWTAAAQAAAATGEASRAADYLAGLARVRSLTLQERQWQAGQLEAAGRSAEALARYRDLATNGEETAWERVGDLEVTLQRPQPAIDAYRRVPSGATNARVALKIARAAAATSRSDDAAVAYAQAVALNSDASVTLEAARYLASVHRFDAALDLYERYVSVQGSDRLELEMARAALAASRPQDALRWTSIALASGRRDEVLFVQAQALHLSGQSAQAAVVLRELLVRDPSQREWQLWLARTSQARDRSLETYELLERVAKADDASAEVLVMRGDAAAQSGDVGRARRDYQRARAVGGDPYLVDERLRRLEGQPQLAMPVEWLTDSHKIEFSRAGAQAIVWPSRIGRFTAGWWTGRTTQDLGARYSWRTAEAQLDRLFLSPRTMVQGGFAVQQSSQGTLPLWNASGRYAWPNGGQVSLSFARETPWSSPHHDMLRFNRIQDLAAVGPLFNNTGGKLSMTFPLSASANVQADLGMRDYSDGNGSRELYMQYQHAWTRGTAWLALQPNVYWEQWQVATPTYYSPEHHVTLATTLRTIAASTNWTLDATLTPQALLSQGRAGMGVTLASGLTRRLGGGALGGNVMWFTDRRYRYQLWRVTGEVRLPLTK